ncbi:MAG: glycosyltransferase family 39 protein [Candidatus Omnitrophota bacterium]
MSNWKQLVILLLILILGLALRIYNLDFPSIGYHNMKENESLSIAQLMRASGDYTNQKVYFVDGLSDTPRYNSGGQLPLVPYQILFAWNIWGENLWGPRLVNVIFGILSVVLLWCLGRLFYKDALCALSAALLLALMPIAVFFSRNLQAESPALFFMLAATLLGARFAASGKHYNLFLSGICMVISWLYKFNFLIGVVPLLFMLPYRRLFTSWKKGLLFCVSFVIPYAGAIVYAYAHNLFSGVPALGESIIDACMLSYWKAHGDMILWYVKVENFTLVFAFLAVAGVCLACFNRRSLFDRYCIGSLAAAIVYTGVYSAQIYQNNFSQMPFVVMVCCAAVYAVQFVAAELKRFFGKNLFIVVMIAAIGISSPAIYGALQRMQVTFFAGLDAAGATLQEFSKPQERVFLLTYAQGNAIARYARRYMGWPATLAEMQEKEKQYGIRLMCIYPADYYGVLQRNNPDIAAYIKNNYRVKEAGLIEKPNNLVYFILERGVEGKTIENYLESAKIQLIPRAIYKVWGNYFFFYAIRPENIMPQDAAVVDETKTQK